MKCDSCGYELMGLPPKGNCPECGAAYDVSVGSGVAGANMSKRLEQMDRRVKLIRTGILLVLAVCSLLITVGATALADKDYRWGVLGSGMFFVVVFALGAAVSQLAGREVNYEGKTGER